MPYSDPNQRVDRDDQNHSGLNAANSGGTNSTACTSGDSETMDEATSSDLSNRRSFMKQGAATASAIAMASPATAQDTTGQQSDTVVRYTFDQADSLCHGPEWESLNPGYWQIKNQALRRRLTNIGDRARRTGFPFHYANLAKKMDTAYDPSLPVGILYSKNCKLSKSYSVEADFVFLNHATAPKQGDSPDWKMFQPGYGRMGIAIGAKCILESFDKIRHAIQVVWCDDNQLRMILPGKNRQDRAPEPVETPQLRRGDQATLRVDVVEADNESRITATLRIGESETTLAATTPSHWSHGYAGVAAQGLVDFEVPQVTVTPRDNTLLNARSSECYACYPLGDSLREIDGQWKVRFVGLFDTDGDHVQLRISRQENPAQGWESVPIAGEAAIVNNRWRRNTTVIEATLPANPATTTLYYTVWKDGINVTADPRIGSDAVGPGTGLVGDVPQSGDYVGRLPQLQAPYKLCGLSCHAITSGLQQRNGQGFQIRGGGDEWQFRDQPTVEAYRHLEQYDFQVMVWEDDVWYMELVLYPPSTDDAYKIVKHSICGPTSRWQMMRHWNVINPGDHDYGMDDVKGPEQIAIRRVAGLGQDHHYMRRNFQIVHHLITGDEDVDPLANPKKWRAWKMPNRDFTFVILDSRLWRSSQDTDMWDDSGWDAFQNLYDRTDPTRSLLGEEQFAWLQTLIQTDSSPVICLTGINGLHTVWAGANYKGGKANHIQGPFDQRDRVTADYAGWVKAGADRVIELLGSRSGIVSVYGDVHNGCILKNAEHNLIECSFGPIGRSGGRAVIPGFGSSMRDFDGRPVEVVSLYHQKHANPELENHGSDEPFYWNFLEMEFDPFAAEHPIQLTVRNMIDAPGAPPRGGGNYQVSLNETGRTPTCKLPQLRTLANADVRLQTLEGTPLRASRSDANGRVLLSGLPDLQPGTQIILIAHHEDEVRSQIVTTQPV